MLIRLLLANRDDREGTGNHRASAWALTGRGWRLGGGAELGDDGEDFARLCIDRHGTGTRLCLHGLLNHKFGWALLFDDRHGAVALRAECLQGVRIEAGAVYSVSDWKAGKELTVSGVEHHHRLRLVAGDKEHMVL